MLAGFARPALAQNERVAVRVVADEAEAVLAIIEAARDGMKPSDDAWKRLFAAEGYRRLKRRDAAMGRPRSDAEFQAFVQTKEVAAAAPQLRATLERWKTANLAAAAAKALAYLPPSATIKARVYPVIKPSDNSFVFETKTDSAAIFLYLDPAVTPARFENTVAHEFHHIGFAKGCAADRPPIGGSLGSAVEWMSAFGEGVAMLAAAGGVDVHPHAASDTADRNRWDRDLENAPADIGQLEAFFGAVLDAKLADPDSIAARGMTFFGVQGPWYTVGYLMASEIERAQGRPALVAVLCDPRQLIRAYQTVAEGSGGRLPSWSPGFVARLTR